MKLLSFVRKLLNQYFLQKISGHAPTDTTAFNLSVPVPHVLLLKVPQWYSLVEKPALSLGIAALAEYQRLCKKENLVSEQTTATKMAPNPMYICIVTTSR